MFQCIHPVLIHPLMVPTNEGTVGKAYENKQTCLFVDIVVAMVRLQEMETLNQAGDHL